MSKARIFIAYSRKDQELRNELRSQLAYLDDAVDVFYDGLIEPGDPWNAILQKQIRHADIVIFLLSGDMVLSEYVMKKEAPPAFERHEKGEAIVIPVLVRDTNPPPIFANSQYLRNHDGGAVSSCIDRDKAWKNIANAIEKKVRKVNARKTARAAGFNTLMLKQVLHLLPKRLVNTNAVWLCSRTGMGWNRDFGEGFRELSSCPEVRFLFLDPDGETFNFDSLLRWKGVHKPGFVVEPAERKEKAKDLYSMLVRLGYNVRVLDVMLPAAFWALGKDGSKIPTNAFIEVPVWESEHGDNLYIEADGTDGYVAAYRQVFENFWNQAKIWRLTRS